VSDRRRAPRILLTGATGGIGGATARLLAARGAELALCGRDEARLDEVAAACQSVGGAPVLLPGDLRPAGQPAAIVEAAVGALGGLDALVDTAGVGWAGPLVEMSDEALSEVVDVDLVTPLRLARAALAVLIRSSVRPPASDPSSSPGGLAVVPGFVFVASIAGHLGVAGEVVYSAAKAGLVAAAEALAEETSGQLAVSVVSPGAVATEFFARRGRPYDRRWPRPIPADRVARAIVASLERPRPLRYVPGWLGVAASVRQLSPSLYRRLATRVAATSGVGQRQPDR